MRFELHSQEKHEYIDGEVRAMGGGTYRHALITSNVTQVLGRQVHPPCHLYSPDLMLVDSHGAGCDVR